MISGPCLRPTDYVRPKEEGLKLETLSLSLSFFQPFCFRFRFSSMLRVFTFHRGSALEALVFSSSTGLKRAGEPETERVFFSRDTEGGVFLPSAA